MFCDVASEVANRIDGVIIYIDLETMAQTDRRLGSNFFELARRQAAGDDTRGNPGGTPVQEELPLCAPHSSVREMVATSDKLRRWRRVGNHGL